MPVAKRQHYIPRMHLKQFVGVQPKGQVWTYDAETGAVRSATPENTAVETHFYSVKAADGTMDTRIEEYLSGVESSAAPVYEALLRGELPGDPQLRVYFSEFLATMYVRTPGMRRMHAEIMSRGAQITNYAYGANVRAFDALVKRMAADGGPVIDEAQKDSVRQALLDPSNFIFEVSKESTIKALAVADKLAPIFFNMEWAVVKPRHGFFITSDNPLVREVDPKTRHPIYGDHGFLNKTAQVIFPLSPQRLLLISWKKSEPGIKIVERKFVDAITRSLAANSDRYLFSHIEHKAIKALATEFKNSRPNMTTQGLGPKKFAETRLVRRLTPDK